MKEVHKVKRAKRSSESKDTTGEVTESRRRLDQIKILTDEEFEQIERLKQMKADRMLDHMTKKRRTSEEATVGEVTAEVDPATIWGNQKKPKNSKEERMASVLEGREERYKFGSKLNRKEKKPGQSTSNTEKKKTKNFILTLHKKANREKRKMGVRERLHAKRLKNKQQGVKRKK